MHPCLDRLASTIRPIQTAQRHREGMDELCAHRDAGQSGELLFLKLRYGVAERLGSKHTGAGQFVQGCQVTLP